MVAQACDTDFMNAHLELISQAISSDKHVLLVMGQAGWHEKSTGLKVPANITILSLPPYTPELN